MGGGDLMGCKKNGQNIVFYQYLKGRKRYHIVSCPMGQLQKTHPEELQTYYFTGIMKGLLNIE